MNIINLIIYFLTLFSVLAIPVCLIVAIVMFFTSGKYEPIRKKQKRQKALWIFLSPIILIVCLIILTFLSSLIS